MDQAMLQISAKKACQAMHAFSRIFPIAQPRAWLCQGWYDWISGKRSQANRIWQKGLGLTEHLAMPYEQARAHYELARHLKDGVKSRLHLEKANNIYTELGILVKAI
jgi:hypothetical protein